MQPKYTARQRAHARLRWIKDAQRLGVSEACNRHGFSRTCYYKWIKRYDGSIESLMDRSRRPHSHPNQLTEQERALIKRVSKKHRKYGLHRLYWLLVSEHGFSRSVGALYKELKRTGFYAPAKRRRRRKYKRYEQPWPGANVQIDVKYLRPIRGVKEYQYTAIDEYSRLRFARIYAEISPRQSIIFLAETLDFFARHRVRVEQVQTDHGTEFTYAFMPHVKREHPFERELRKAGIAQKLTPIGKPHLQGKVERSHRIDDDEFHSLRFFRTSQERKRSFNAYITSYNHRRAHGSLNWRTPKQHLDDYFQQAQSVSHV